MIIKTQLTQKDFINGSLVLLYSKWNLKIISIIAGLMFIASLVIFAAGPQYGDPTSSMLVSLFMALWLPGLTYFSAKKNYNTNSRASEPIEYTFEENAMTITGSSFNATLSWNKFYKVSKTKNWVLIWQTSKSANLIPRRDITDNEIGYLKKIITSNRVKNNL